LKRVPFARLYAAIAVGSIILVAVNAAEYQQFFPAITSLQALPDSQRIVNVVMPNATWIFLYFHITNPSTYSGLRIAWVNIQLNFETANSFSPTFNVLGGSGSATSRMFPITGYNSSLNPKYTIFSSNTVESPLGPGQTVHINATFVLSTNQTKTFAMLYQSSGTAQFAHYVLDIHLITFLEATAAFDIYREISYPIH